MISRTRPPFCWTVWLAALLASLSVVAQEGRGKQHPGFTGRLASPELLIGLREKLELTNQQTDEIKLIYERIRPQAEAAQRETQKKTSALHGYLENEKLDPAEAAKYLERLSKAENGTKRVQISLMIEIDKVLSATQRKKLAELRASGEILKMMERGKDLQQRLQAKAARFQEQLRIYADLGGPPYKVASLAEKIRRAMDEKDFKTAEKLLDEALAEAEK